MGCLADRVDESKGKTKRRGKSTGVGAPSNSTDVNELEAKKVEQDSVRGIPADANGLGGKKVQLAGVEHNPGGQEVNTSL